jgi:hypothetical protein
MALRVYISNKQTLADLAASSGLIVWGLKDLPPGCIHHLS